MNLYDPANFITYVSPGQRQTAAAACAEVPAPRHRLPGGYANQSPRTRLRRDPADPPVADVRRRAGTTTRRDAVTLEEALRALRAAPIGEQLLPCQADVHYTLEMPLLASGSRRY